MNLYSISDNLRGLIGDSSHVIAAIFTTFNFEPDFFEEEIIPLLLDRDLAFSSDKQVKSVQVREALNEAQIPIEVFYDANIFQQQADRSPAMEYFHHGIDEAPNAFHGKISLILLEDRETSQQSLLVGAGSANLTNAGWWENIECQHWETVDDGGISRAFKNRLQEDTALLGEYRQALSPIAQTASDHVNAFLTRCSASNSSRAIHYYGLAGRRRWAQKRRSAFVNFLRKALHECSPYYSRWNLEIISPYFAEDSDFDGHRQLAEDLGADRIRLLLPTNERSKALCTEAYYQNIDQADGVEWATWSETLAKALGIDSDARRSHTKLYHIYNGKQSWVFAGSVNFSHQAFFNNIEAGFFTRVDDGKPLLKPLENPHEGEFCDPEELHREDVDAVAEGRLPAITLVFDWKTDCLSGCANGKQDIVIHLLTAERDVLVSDVKLSDKLERIQCDAAALRALLRHSGFIKIAGFHDEDHAPIAEQQVLVQQINWTHKPLDLPHLTPQQIIEIYAGLSFERRNQLVARLKEIQLRRQGLTSQYGFLDEYEQSGKQFFCEYAELFQGFRNIRRRIKQALDDGHGNLVDYYLTGCGIDSLPALFDSLFEDDSAIEPVTRYLALLCLRQIYSSGEFRDCHGVSEQLACVHSKIGNIETSDELELTPRNAERPAVFYEWFRGQFFQPYVTEPTTKANAAD